MPSIFCKALRSKVLELVRMLVEDMQACKKVVGKLACTLEAGKRVCTQGGKQVCKLEAGKQVGTQARMVAERTVVERTVVERMVVRKQEQYYRSTCQSNQPIEVLSRSNRASQPSFLVVFSLKTPLYSLG